jgi:L-fucose isomerase-like protein
MFAAAAEDSGNDLINGRGDAYCGMLSASYNLGLRRLRPYIPEYPVGDAKDIAAMLADFIPVARTVIGVRSLKIISFGPRPFDFLTCHAPIQPLFDLGVEVMENSELDLYDLVQAEKGSSDVKRIARNIAKELGQGNTYPDLNEKVARYEAALEKYMQANVGASRFVAFANKCWPAFEKYFGHVPCYMNSRLAAKGIPVACEADIYGALSEYMSICATELPPTILDINNSVPKDMYAECKKAIGDYALTDLWMGFHCGNTSSACLMNPSMQHQLIMHRLMEPEKQPDITRGTLEGRIKAGPISVFRIQSTPESRIHAYMANGEVLDVNPRSFGSIGVFAIREMGRFYRHVLIEKRFPHHTAVAFKHAGKTLFAACRMLGVDELFFNHPKGVFYPSENPF